MINAITGLLLCCEIVTAVVVFGTLMLLCLNSHGKSTFENVKANLMGFIK